MHSTAITYIRELGQIHSVAAGDGRQVDVQPAEAASDRSCRQAPAHIGAAT